MNPRLLPPVAPLKPFWKAYAIRGLFVWIATRLAAAWITASLPAASGTGAALNVAQEGFVLMVVAGAVLLDARRRGEDVFLANLGVAGGWIAVAALPLALLLETVVP